MPDETKPADSKAAGLPGNHGQFGENNATEDFKPLEDHPAPAKQAPAGPKQTNAGERS